MSTSLLLVGVPVVLAAVAAVITARLSRTRSGPQRRFWTFIAPASLAWGLATTTSQLPAVGDPAGGVTSTVLGLVVLGTILAWPTLAISGIAMLTGPYQTRGSVVRDVLDILLLVLAGLTALWTFVLAPVWGDGPSGLAGWLVVVIIVLAIDVPLTGFHALLRSPERERGVRLAAAGLGVVCLGDISSARSYFVDGQGTDAMSGALWGLGWALVLVGAWLQRGRPQLPPDSRGLSGDAVQTAAAAIVTVTATVFGLVRSGGTSDPVSFWLSTSVLFFVVCRTLLELRRTTRLQRHLERKVEQRTRALADSHRRFAALVAHGSDLVIVVDAEERLDYANPGAARLLGVDPGSTFGRPAADHLHDEDGAASSVDVLRSMVVTGTEHLEVRLALRHADGHRVDVDAVVTNLLHDPDVRGMVINARDVSDALRLERELSRQAFSDSLTGLPNRALFRDRLEQALRSRASRGPVKVMYLDLDGFKAVNDTLGHDAGDELLVAVAQRLVAALRAGDTVARLGGDEFAVLLDEGIELEEAKDLAQRLCDVLRRPFDVRGAEVRVGTSVGLASSRTAGRSAEELMRAADTAMYGAKAAGKGTYAIYSPLMLEALEARVKLEADLRRAVEQHQFRVVYQPLVDIGTGSVNGVEALVRWHHPERGLIGPVDFIPLAESTGLIGAIGEYVLREACQQVAGWRSTVPGAENLRVSVNLSAQQLEDPGLLSLVTQVLQETGLPATSLVLEITEGVLVNHHEAALSTLNALRAMGVRLAIDDFGTGYSSLSYLHRLPVDILKIDKSFVDRLSDNGDLSLVDAIVSMATTLGLATVAEGIEHEHQRTALQIQGCDTGQGYHFSPPVSAELVPELVVAALTSPSAAQPLERTGEPSTASVEG
ncbi:PAS domain S-box-containing protein/diguanylate cyclase (GGDEF) domain-containing protein [Quadrisphaera granulorum]|uniref:PAS domain S-box-containing protein/diguanylate cyclase (GGDEF)-like protein n=1 Tax=Quadrisphaera granulorum TaxID=317664 RepID=A0A316A897_9ACTN|nr:bifunctional diguanylate cyclase/phosphodiesterase [Quadrisphaera granulorum]PWJ53712.1 PAS domain S-box-containing protein/diguanylate cyclase (GGDEF)-like protein [Quadrisphaera granulorum]SZE96756.1 PAS domain S-box-containing protein/diguanylate cyclase (GGDEF) domain-containing protein [Quadrisphaera granulorum]